MNGRWLFKYDNRFRGASFNETFYVIDGVVHTVNGNKSTATYKIDFFFYDAIEMRIYLRLKFYPDTEEANYLETLDSYSDELEFSNDQAWRTFIRSKYSLAIIHDLEVKSDKLLTGTENVEGYITYEKIG